MELFKEYLCRKGFSKNTISAYIFSAKQFENIFETVTYDSLESYRSFLIDTYSAKTVNTRINGLNAYLKFLGQTDHQLKSVRIQQKPFLENVISKNEYCSFIQYLKRLPDLRWYFAVRFLANTGARVSELLKIEVTDVESGHKDIISKGNKLRRVYIPTELKVECLEWLKSERIHRGPVFRNRSNKRITARGLSGRLKQFAEECGVNPEVVYPHSFRHRFAKNFLEKSSDIAFLADLMGHESIETTRIYLRKTSTEQREAVDSIVDW